jgi:hypothetical protein
MLRPKHTPISVLAARDALRGARETVSGCLMSKDNDATFRYRAREPSWLTFARCGDLSHIGAKELDPVAVLNRRQ